MGNCSVLRPYRSKIFEDKAEINKYIYCIYFDITTAPYDTHKKTGRYGQKVAKKWPKNGQIWPDVLDMWQITFVSSLQIFLAT